MKDVKVERSVMYNGYCLVTVGVKSKLLPLVGIINHRYPTAGTSA